MIVAQIPSSSQKVNRGAVFSQRLSSYGMRWLHVVRMGRPVDVADWIDQVPFYARDLVTIHRQYERGVGIHHLRLWRPAREAVTLRNPRYPEYDGRPALIWSVADGQGVREAATYAAVAFLDTFGSWPSTVLIRDLPRNAPARFTVFEDEGERVEVALRRTPWAPKGFLFLVGGER